MQASMGPAASTLNSFLDMYDPTNMGSEELVEAHLLQARKDLIRAVRSSGDCTTLVEQLVHLKCPVSMKYAQLNVGQLLRDNNRSVAHLKTIPSAMGMLEKYGRHLLKPPGARVDQWRQIKFNNPIFKNRVEPMKGAKEVLKQMGYTAVTDSGLQFEAVEPNPESTSNLVADIILARAEMEYYLLGKHPHPETVHALLPEATIDQLIEHWDQQMGMEGATVNINAPASSVTPQQLHPPTPVSVPVEAETVLGAPVQMSELVPTPVSVSDSLLMTPTQQQEDSLHKACDICGDTAATLWCRLCDNKQLCNACDEMWHRHPKRQNHEREPITSLPSPSTAQVPDAILGPFGIRAVHSLSSQSKDVGQSPPPNGGAQSSGNGRSSSRTPPPQQVETSPVQSQQQTMDPSQLQHVPLDASASLQLHQRQLQMYLQQQELNQMQQHLYNTGGGMLSSQLQTGVPVSGRQDIPRGETTLGTMTSPNLFYPPASVPAPAYAGFTNPGMMYTTGSAQNMPYPAVSTQPNPGLPPFPMLDPEPGQKKHWERGSVSHPPAVLEQGQVAYPSQPGAGVQVNQHLAQPGGVGDTGPGTGVSDKSLSQQTRTGNLKEGNSAPVLEAMYGTGLERRNSGRNPHGSSSMAGTMSESSLLKAVLAESDYEKRAAKCDIRLLTLEEDMQELESQLNELMLNEPDFTECDEFLVLNRRKARLMKEHKALSQYKEELAGLMSVEPIHRAEAHGSENPVPHIFHPPPLSSSSQSPLSTSASAYHLAPTLPGLGYSHQASRSAPNLDPTIDPNSALLKGFSGNIPHSQVSYPAGGQESVPPSAVANTNSSVDRSSLLPQWQMIPSTTSICPGEVVNQSPYYPPPRYQEGNFSNSCLPSGSNSAVFHAQPTVGNLHSPKFTTAEMGRPSAQEHSAAHNAGIVYPNHRDQGFKEGQQQGLHHLGSTPGSDMHGQPMPGAQGGGLIGFEQIVAEEGSMLHPTDPTEGFLSPPSRSATSGTATLTPSPPSQPQATLTPPLSQSSQRFTAPAQRWVCSHCTFINDPGTRVCNMCDRTSDNPELVQETSSSNVPNGENSPLTGEYLEATVASASASGMVPEAAAAAEMPVANMEQLANFHSRIAEEQDQIYLEKKEAHEQYFRTLQLHGQEAPPSLLDNYACPPSISPPPLPSRIPTPPPKPPVPSRRPSAPKAKSTKEPAEVEMASSAQVRHDLPASVASSESVSARPQAVPVQNLVEGGGDSLGPGSFDSASFIQEGDFSMTMERFSEQKKIKQMQLDGADLMHFMKMAERQGFQLEEMQAALHHCNGKHHQALEWLRVDWNKLVQVVVASTRAEGQRLQQNSVGDLSAEEAWQALRASQGDMMDAVKSCVAQRRQLYARLNPDGTYAREEVLQAMLQSKGDEDAARQQLHLAVLQPFIDRVWQSQDGEGGRGAAAASTMGAGGAAAGAAESRTLLEMTMSEATCRSVSTSIISHADFQQTIMDKNVDRDRRVRLILVEGKLRSWGRADMVINLLDTDLPATYPPVDGEAPPYTLEDVVEAVRNCRDRHSARVYLTQECSTCYSNYPMSKIRNLNFCQCKICSDCLKQNFEVVIREKHVRHWTCPICGLPDLNDADTASEHLSFLAMLLQTQVDKEVYDLFETKVRDWHLQKDPNFRWCAHCGNGFIADERQLRMECPHCSNTTCYLCKKQWEDQHEGLTCDQFAQWKIDNDPNNQAVGLARHLEENGIDCPSCKMRYALAKGGCMHFKCPQCGHEFCSGCCQPFYQKGNCPIRLKSCKMSGLHAHHPRDCFFYLRDESVDRLQSLLREAKVQFNTVPPESQEDASHCPVIEQKEFDSGKCDESCGKDTLEGHAGLCVNHYKEYLVGLINRNHLDPADVMTIDEIKTLLKRREISCPKVSSNESEANFHKRLIKFVKEKILLPARGP